MNDETKWGGGVGLIIVLLILFAVFGGSWGGFGGFGNRGGFFPGWGGVDYAAIAQSERQQIIDSAQTRYLIEQQAAQTREAVVAGNNALATKVDFYEYQKQRDKTAELERKVIELQNQMFTKDQLAPINAQLAAIRCNMLVKPDVTGVGVCCPNQAVLNGMGIGNCNGCSGCGLV